MTKNMFALVLALTFGVTACSTQTANLQYSEFNDRMLVKAEAVSGQDLGPVKGGHGGAIWDSCDEHARNAVTRMIESAKLKGANAVGNVKWATSGNSTPSCKKQWGWFALWPFILTPLFMQVEVSGTGYKTDAAKAKKAGLMMLPSNQAELDMFVQKVMAL